MAGQNQVTHHHRRLDTTLVSEAALLAGLVARRHRIVEKTKVPIEDGLQTEMEIVDIVDLIAGIYVILPLLPLVAHHRQQPRAAAKATIQDPATIDVAVTPTTRITSVVPIKIPSLAM